MSSNLWGVLACIFLLLSHPFVLPKFGNSALLLEGCFVPTNQQSFSSLLIIQKCALKCSNHMGKGIQECRLSLGASVHCEADGDQLQTACWTNAAELPMRHPISSAEASLPPDKANCRVLTSAWKTLLAQLAILILIITIVKSSSSYIYLLYLLLNVKAEIEMSVSIGFSFR